MPPHGDHRAPLGIVTRSAALVVLALLLLLATAPAGVAGPGSRFPAQESPPELRPVQIVVLVDESGSLSPEDVARERDAVRVIVQGEPSPESTVSVVGFASANGPGQTPVDPVCPPTRLDTAQNRQFLAECVGLLRSRTPAEGADTDHVNALRQALSYLSAPAAGGQPKIVFLLTDGVLDVSNSPAYGANLSPGDRNIVARQQVPGVLDELSRAGVQVWPLGFGAADKAQLDGFATGGAQASCGVRTPRPSATLITGSADLLGALGAASSTARCTSVGDLVPGQLPPGGSVDLTVDVPAIATDGSILVFKRDPRITAGYLDPEGTAVPTNGDLGISRFALSGQNTEVESLRIVNPAPGRWTVRLSSAPGVPPQDVGVIVIFQGAIRAVLTVSPPSPPAGSEVDVTMQVRGAQAAIADPAQLQGLTFVAALSGDGFAPVLPVELVDGDGDGQYQGRITVPDTATGRLDFVGSVTGIGVSGDERVFATRVAAGAAGVLGVLTLDGVDTDAVAGTSLTGTANVTNSSGQQRTLRIEVAEPSPGAVVAVEPAQLAVPASGQAVLPFTVRFDPATALGPNQARLRLVDTADGALVGELLFARNVVPEPTFVERFWWLWLLMCLLIAGGIAAAAKTWWDDRLARETRGIRVELHRRGDVVDDLTARSRGDKFRFGVRRGEGTTPARLTAGTGGDRYQVHRGRAGVTVIGPSGAPVDLSPSGALDLGDGVELVVRDRTAARPARPVRKTPTGVAAGDPPWPRYDDSPY